MSTATEGSKVSVHYVGRLNDETQFDSSRERGAPLEFQLGSGQVIPGFSNNIVGLTSGESKTFTIPSSEAYGEFEETGIQPVPRNRFPEGFETEVGSRVSGNAENGTPFTAEVVSINDETITLDFNHPLAGKDLTFEVELLSVNE